MADIGTSLAALAIILSFASVGGWIVYYSYKGIPGLCRGCCGDVYIPPLLGMLLGGCVAMQAVNPIVGDLDPEWSLVIRKIAITVILLRAGLGLNLIELKKKSLAVILLTVLPQLVELGVCGLLITFMYPMYWPLAFAAGCMMGAVSPAVVVPTCIRLNSLGYGADKGISGIVIAASSLDDILAISLFGVFLGIGMGGEGGMFGDNPTVNAALTGPFELVAGVILGILIGLSLRTQWFTRIPARYKALILLSLAMALTFLWGIINMSGLGYLATISSASIGATHWGNDEADAVEAIVSYAWLVLQVPLFGLIGSSLYFIDLDWQDVGIGLFVIFIGLLFRVPTAGAAMYGTDLTFREKCFVAIAWMSKATVQAALGGVVIGQAEDDDLGSEFVLAGERHLILAFFSIVITAPIGAILTAWLGTKLLTRSKRATMQTQRDLTTQAQLEEMMHKLKSDDQLSQSQFEMYDVRRLQHENNAIDGIPEPCKPDRSLQDVITM